MCHCSNVYALLYGRTDLGRAHSQTIELEVETRKSLVKDEQEQAGGWGGDDSIAAAAANIPVCGSTNIREMRPSFSHDPTL